jgi:Fic family protein
MEQLVQLSQLATLQQIDNLKSEIDALRPLSKEQENRIMQKFRLDWNYHSNAIEGNSLNYGETVAFLMHGITAKGKPFKDYLDIKGHNEAIDFLLELIRNDENLTEKDIRNLHELLLVEPYEVKAQTPDGYPTTKLIIPGRYKTSPNHVRTVTGEVHYYSTPEETPIKMQELMDWYREAKANPKIHPAVLAAVFHHRFVSIHPFDDGNGRMTRLLMNLMLMQAHYPPVVIKNQDRGTYYLTLSQADTGDVEPFVDFIVENVIRALEFYLKGARGENLEEGSDLDKELALFRKELAGDKENFDLKRSIESQKVVYNQVLKPLVEQVRLTVAKFRDMFLSYSESELKYSKDATGQLQENYYGLGDYRDYEHSFAYWINTSIAFSSFTMVFKLGEFKQQYNTFDVVTLVEFSFDEYKYYLSFGLKENHKTAMERLYNQRLNEHEIEQIAETIGKEILAYIKQHRRNGLTSS